jgi:chromate transporter
MAPETERETEKQDRPRIAVEFREAFRYWLKLGFINFGGPAGQIAIMHRDLVERRRWISEERFLHALNFCMLLPGPEATQLACYVGFLLHGTLGGLVAGIFFVLPSIFCLLALSYVYAAYGDVRVVAGVLAGFKPVVVAIVVEAVIRIGRRALKRPAHVAIAAAAFVGLYFFGVPFPAIVLAAGVIGLAVRSDGPPPDGEDDMPTPEHALPSRRRLVKTLAVGVVLWAAPFAALLAWRGWGSLHAQEYRFFTLAAFVTFGGAYAVLAYTTHAAATTFGWMSQVQAVDGLALAETTPGPLIMVLQFMGFMAAWNHPEGLSPTASAVVGALVTTWTTFLPTFLFIFIGAPYIEVLRGNRALSSALAGVTAAVVGVILNLALVFGAAVIWPRGFDERPDLFAIALSAAAFAVLYRFKVDVAWIVLAGGLVGLAAR